MEHRTHLPRVPPQDGHDVRLPQVPMNKSRTVQHVQSRIDIVHDTGLVLGGLVQCHVLLEGGYNIHNDHCDTAEEGHTFAQPLVVARIVLQTPR